MAWRCVDIAAGLGRVLSGMANGNVDRTEKRYRIVVLISGCVLIYNGFGLEVSDDLVPPSMAPVRPQAWELGSPSRFSSLLSCASPTLMVASPGTNLIRGCPVWLISNSTN